MPYKAATLQANGPKIQLLRKYCGLTQDQLAERTGIDVKTIRRVEKGGRTTLLTLGCIAQFLGVAIAEITVDDRAVVVDDTLSAEPAPAQIGNVSVASGRRKSSDAPIPAQVRGRDPSEEIRGRLQDVADRDLQRRLHSSDPNAYIPLELRAGCMPSAGRNAEATRETIETPFNLGRRWLPLDTQTLMYPQQTFFLTSVAGGGKTVFLRWLQKEIAARPELLPFYVKASELDALDALSWEHVRVLLS